VLAFQSHEALKREACIAPFAHSNERPGGAVKIKLPSAQRNLDRPDAFAACAPQSKKVNCTPRMGFYYRKSIGLGPFRVNVSKSGFGYSMGSPGFRTGISARGRRYTTFGIPGTGLGYRTSKSQGCLVLIIGLLALAGTILKRLL
jgi:hypothetical protein